MGLRVSLAVTITRLTRDELFKTSKQIVRYVGVPVFGDDDRGGGMWNEDIAEPALEPTLSDPGLDLFGHIKQLGCFSVVI